MRSLSVTILVAGFAANAAVKPHKLLSENARGDAFASETPRLVTGATLSWVEEGEFATDANIVKTQRDGAGRQRAADGTFRVRFGASPIYLRAAAPVALLGADAATMQE